MYGFDGGVEELVGLEVEDQADAVNGLGGGKAGQVTTTVADLREGLLGRTIKLEREKIDVGTPSSDKKSGVLRLGVLNDDLKADVT